jgi:hypothetical protein
MKAIDIAEEAHKICVKQLIPNGISPEHEISAHILTSSFYADVLTGADAHATGKEVVEAIIRATGWDMKSPWPGHPHPDLVLAALSKQKS